MTTKSKKINYKVKKLIKEGYPRKQAVAIAYSYYNKGCLGKRGGIKTKCRRKSRKRKTKRKSRKTKRSKKKTKKSRKYKKNNNNKMYKVVRETYKPTLLNIYNENLKPCGNNTMGSGSWDNNYMCSEKDGGVHQICIDSIGTNTNQFSKNTGQSDWSTGRGNNNHCVCLGAWSLYNYKKNNQGLNDTQTKKLKCDAIPNYSLSQRYIKKFIDSDSQGWEEWNDNEQDNQIMDGVHSMVDECYVEGNDEQRRQLRDNYCNFAGGVDRLRNTDFYKKMC